MNQNLKLIYMLSKVLGALEMVSITAKLPEEVILELIKEIKQTLDEATKG